MARTFTDKLRITLFRKQINDKPHLSYLTEKTDDEILVLLDSTVVPNSVDTNSIKYTLLFNLLFLENNYKRERVINHIKKIISLTGNLTKTEKMIIKFGLIHGFSSRNYRKEMFRYIKIPLALRDNGGGRKIITSYKFKEVFSFAYNLVKRGNNNERLPRI